MSTISATSQTTAGTRQKIRVLAVIGAALAALVVWGVAKALVADLRQPSFGSGDPQHLSAGFVIVAALVGSLLAWAVVALLERLLENPRRVWSIVAPLALLISFGGPLSGHGISGDNRLALALMHVAVAAVVIPLYWRTAPESAASRREGRA